VPSPERCAAAIADLFAGVFGLLEDWRAEIVGTLGDAPAVAALDDLVARRVLPALTPDSLLIGAGFIASPDYVHGRDVHFAWWLGPLDAGPIFGSTDAPTRLDLATRGHADYLRDVRSLEWYAAAEASSTGHITGPYIDHLCTCDLILTLTVPVRVAGRMAGVVGADIALRRLEVEVLPLLLAVEHPLALVNADGRVVVSTDPTAPAGALLPGDLPAAPCAGIPLRVVTPVRSSGESLQTG